MDAGEKLQVQPHAYRIERIVGDVAIDIVNARPESHIDGTAHQDERLRGIRRLRAPEELLGHDLQIRLQAQQWERPVLIAYHRGQRIALDITHVDILHHAQIVHPKTQTVALTGHSRQGHTYADNQ